MHSLTGIGVSPGVVVGPIYKIEKVVINQPVTASPREIYAALTAVAEDLDYRALNAELEIAREVLQAQAMIAQDPALVEAIGARFPDDIQYPDVRSGVTDAFSGFRRALESLGGYFAERVSDLDEICERTLAYLAGIDAPTIVLSTPSIVIAEDLTPADTAALDLNFA
ncbi:MAG: Phosphoenolpyruvate-protein phosphotransferase, partial [Actinomycetota bacterium]